MLANPIVLSYPPRVIKVCFLSFSIPVSGRRSSIKRKFTITKALLFMADRSSIDRLRQQGYKSFCEETRLLSEQRLAILPHRDSEEIYILP
ncbi:hypothetical protein NC652_008029 [Populus alba x Populus x berolinensis]|nr:hypothetical protein NC652_008029 [Populus alba x Populus x berolinensis]